MEKGKGRILLALCGVMLQMNYLLHLPQIFSYQGSCQRKKKKKKKQNLG